MGWQVHPFDQCAIARRVQFLEKRPGRTNLKHDGIFSAVKGLFQPLKGLVYFAQTAIDKGNIRCQHMPTASLVNLLVQNASGVLDPAMQNIGLCQGRGGKATSRLYIVGPLGVLQCLPRLAAVAVDITEHTHRLRVIGVQLEYRLIGFFRLIELTGIEVEIP
jgi:hypothetical protein